MKFKYRIRVFERTYRHKDQREMRSYYMPQRKLTGFLGVIMKWENVSDYSFTKEGDAREAIEDDKIYIEERYKKTVYKYINVE